MDTAYDHLDSVMIQAQQLSFRYEGSAKDDLEVDHLAIPKGQCVVLCGPNGSGKSTFLKLINGLVPEYVPGNLTGLLSVDGLAVGQLPTQKLSHSVASVFQNPASQFFQQKVKEELVFPAENQGRAADRIQQQMQALVRQFGLEDYLERDMLTLSGGEKQRVAFLTALMQDTPVLVLDEPTAFLDETGIQQVREMLTYLKNEGKTILIAEHRLDYLTGLADRYLYFDQGRCCRDWSADQFLAMSDEERHAYQLRALSPASLQQRPAQVTGSGELMIHDLSLTVAGTELAYIDLLRFPRGQITAITGPNGSGKSTLAHYLVGLRTDPTAGFQLDGRFLSAQERLRQLSLVQQEVRLQLFTDRVQTELTLGLSKNVDTSQVVEALQLTELLDRHPMTLSGGEQQRLIIASQLLSDKEVFVFDEPSSGLDFQQMHALSQLLLGLKDQGKVVILISHDRELMASVAGHVIEWS